MANFRRLEPFRAHTMLDFISADYCNLARLRFRS
jgi:hypothetical protein